MPRRLPRTRPWRQARLRPEGLLDGVPTHLPALMQAQKVSRKAAAVGFEWETVQDVWDEVAEERAEFEAEAPGSSEREMEFGDLLFALVNVARKEGIDAESALRASHGQVPPPLGRDGADGGQRPCGSG